MKTRLIIKVSLAMFTGFLVYFTITFFNQQQIFNIKNSRLKQLNLQIQEQHQINGELKTKLDLIDTHEYVERMAREKLGMVKRGERIFIDVRD